MAEPQQGVLSPICRTMRSWTTQSRVIAVLLASVVTGVAAVHFGNEAGSVFKMYDGLNYVWIAQGYNSIVMQPFASRQLGALIVRGIMALLHTQNWHLGFGIEAAFSLTFLIGWVYWTMSKSLAPRWLMAACLMLPFWRGVYHGVILPDLFYAALICVFLALLEAEQLTWAALFLLPMMVARESTSLTLVCFLIAAWGRLGWGQRVLAVVSAAAGSVIVGRLSGGAQNMEHIPQSIYMMAKVPWNSLRLVGVEPYANVFPLCTEPRWQRAVHFGSLRAIGVCSFTIDTPIVAMAMAITMFGLLLPVVFFLLRARRWRLGNDVMVRFAVIYGATSFLLAPLLGTAFDRLFNYAWPLFVVALPRLWTAEGRATSTRTVSPGLAAGFTVLNLLYCLFSMFNFFTPYTRIGIELAVTVVVCVGCARVFRPVAEA